MGLLSFQMPGIYCKVFLVLVLQRATNNRIDGALQLFYLNVTSWSQERHKTQEVNKTYATQEDNKTSTTQEVNKTYTTQRSSWLHCLYACLFDLLSYMQLLLFLPPTSVCGCPCSLHVPSPNPPHCRRLSPSASDLPAESSPVKGALVYKRCPIILPFLPLTCHA